MQTCVVTMRNIRSIITVENTGNTSLGFKYAHEKNRLHSTFDKQDEGDWLID
jgi:hypothetical protein